MLQSNGTKWRNGEVFCCERYTIVLKDGNATDIFINTSVDERGSDQPAEFEGAVVPENLQHHTGSREDIINLRHQGSKLMMTMILWKTIDKLK